MEEVKYKSMEQANEEAKKAVDKARYDYVFWTKNFLYLWIFGIRFGFQGLRNSGNDKADKPANLSFSLFLSSRS